MILSSTQNANVFRSLDVTIWLDGKRLVNSSVFGVDTVAGIICRYKKDETGKFIRNGNLLEVETLTGDVEIRIGNGK